LVKVKDLRITDSFELKGEWYLPGTDQKFGGTLVYNYDGIYLELYGAFQKNEECFTINNNKFDFIIGNCENSIEVTLLDGFEINHQFGYIEISKLTFNQMLIGGHFTSEEEIKFHWMNVKYTYLEEWFEDRVFNDLFSDSKPRTCEIKYTQPDFRFEVEIPIVNAILKGGNYYKFIHGLYEQKITHENCIGIYPNNEKTKSFKWYIEIENKIKGLLAFLINRPVYLTQIIAKVEHDKRFNGYEDIYVFPSKANKFKKVKINPSSLFITLNDIGDSLQKVVNSWFDEKMEKSIKNYTRNIFRGESDTLTNFINYTKALESLHRETSENAQYMSKSRYEKIKKKMLEAITDDVSEEFKNKLRGDLGYFYQHEFGKRITDVFESLDVRIKEFILSDKSIESFVNRIKRSRNYYTHYGKKQEGVFEEGLELYFVNAMLKIVSFYWIAKELSFEDDFLYNSLEKDYSLKDMLERARSIL
jgi:hypothetical protein